METLLDKMLSYRRETVLLVWTGFRIYVVTCQAQLTDELYF